MKITPGSYALKHHWGTRTAATIRLMMGALTVIGVLISDLLLAWLDPRIRKGFEG